MIVLDTNVVSELMRPEPNPRVLAWLAGQPLSELALTAITVLEIRLGLRRMADGKRRTALEGRFGQFLSEAFQGRVLPFNHEAAEECAALLVYRQQLGCPLDNHLADAMIAAIAKVKGCRLATRNRRDFEDTRLELVDPWNEVA